MRLVAGRRGAVVGLPLAALALFASTASAAWWTSLFLPGILGASEEASAVVALTEKTYDKFIAANKVVLVEFFAPCMRTPFTLPHHR